MYFRIRKPFISIFNKQIVNFTELFRKWKRMSFQIQGYTAVRHTNSWIWDFWQEICNEYHSYGFLYIYLPCIITICSNLMDSFLVKINWENSLQNLFPILCNSFLEKTEYCQREVKLLKDKAHLPENGTLLLYAKAEYANEIYVNKHFSDQKIIT